LLREINEIADSEENMEYKYLDGINSPSDIKNLSYKELDVLCEEIRDYIVEVITKNGGHLASNLGVVELTVALHRVFNSPEDKIIWDVGHQSYVHKILTGRREEFSTIRLHEGLSGFPKRSESDHDIFETGHSSTSISAALGIAKARDLNGEDNAVVAIIGDGAMTGGMAFEALNHAGHLKSKLLVILNDNDMSIAKNIGGMSKYLSRIRTGSTYFKFKTILSGLFKKIPIIGKTLLFVAESIRDLFKYIMVSGIIFEKLGFKYIGPVDGHDIKFLEMVLKQINDYDKKPVMLHIVTKKGKGFEKAENSPAKYHGISPIPTTDNVCEKDDKNSFTDLQIGFSEVFGNKLTELAEIDKKIVAITAAMVDGTGLKSFAQKFPDRLFDVGIAEQHAVTFGAGLSEGGMMPVFAVYSTFLQRAYDQIIHDVAMQNLPFIFAIDRAGLVGADGETHHGVFDLSFTSHVPNLTVMCPKDGTELEMMLEYAVKNRLTATIRYPRGKAFHFIVNCTELRPIELGKLEWIKKGEKIGIVSEGVSFRKAWHIYEKLLEKGYNPSLINVRFLAPMDVQGIIELGKTHEKIYTIEENIDHGGLGDRISKIFTDYNITSKLRSFAYPKEFMKHGEVALLEQDYGMNWEAILSNIEESILCE